MKIVWVNSIKFQNMDRLNHQVRLAMIRFGKTSGHYEIGDRYEVDGMVKLVLQ